MLPFLDLHFIQLRDEAVEFESKIANKSFFLKDSSFVGLVEVKS